MSQPIVHILCEGQTEGRFVKEVLSPYLLSEGIAVKYQLLITSRRQQAQGGMISYIQAKRDLQLCMKQVKDNDYETHFFTTMFDLYALPDDFPGYAESNNISDPYAKIECLEAAFTEDIALHKFIPYIQLHEFEALVFCGIEHLKTEYPLCTKDIDLLKQVLEAYQGNPELINSGRNTAPSKRIIKAIEGSRKYKYNKPKSGVAVTQAEGIDSLMSKCKHFKEWVERLSSLSLL